MTATRLSQISNDRAADMLLKISAPLLEMLSDEELTESLKMELGGPPVTRAEVKQLGMARFTKLISIVLGKKRDCFFALIAPFFGVSESEIAQANVLDTVKELYEVFSEKEFRDFLSLLQGPDAG